MPTKVIDFPSWTGAYAREMYVRHTTRVKDGKAHTDWRLVRSVRVGRKVVQQTVAPLGELDAEGRVRVERGRSFGDVWLTWTLWRALRLDTVLERLLPPGREEVPWATMAAVLVLARLWPGSPSALRRPPRCR